MPLSNEGISQHYRLLCFCSASYSTFTYFWLYLCSRHRITDKQLLMFSSFITYLHIISLYHTYVSHFTTVSGRRLPSCHRCSWAVTAYHRETNMRRDADTAPLVTERSQLPAPDYGTVFRHTWKMHVNCLTSDTANNVIFSPILLCIALGTDND